MCTSRRPVPPGSIRSHVHRNPVTFAAIGIIAALVLAAVGAISALVAKFTIVIERANPPNKTY
jgi:hypothetical protein